MSVCPYCDGSARFLGPCDNASCREQWKLDCEKAAWGPHPLPKPFETQKERAQREVREAVAEIEARNPGVTI